MRPLTLIALYTSTDSPNWQNNDNWLSAPIGEWDGVIADSSGRVIELHGSGQMSGEIPPELGKLANLRWLSLRYHELSGEIPPELSNLVSSERLDLSDNNLSGEIPPELGNLTNLGRDTAGTGVP